ncbi:unnamed protein product [marine sediment metagenome]|uniref:Uncharacterized protein n=1 Tax=marine sediment metagenome TaxID=412755 RepID=X1UPQ2_9ZZZZ
MDYEDNGDIDAAIREAKLAVGANPDSSKPVRELGYYFFKKDDLEEAEKWLVKATEMNHLDVFAFHYLGTIYIKKNDIEKAEYCLDKAMEISPRHIDRGIDFAKILIQRKMFAKAAKVFDKIINFSGRDSELQEEIANFCIEKKVNEYAAKLQEEIANFCIEKKVNEYAAKLLKSLVERYPERSDLLFNLGKIREELGVGREMKSDGKLKIAIITFLLTTNLSSRFRENEQGIVL